MLVGNQAKHVSEVWDWSEICGRSILEYLWKSAPLGGASVQWSLWEGEVLKFSKYMIEFRNVLKVNFSLN